MSKNLEKRQFSTLQIDPQRSAVLVIDMSRDFLDPQMRGRWGPSTEFEEGREMAERLAVLLARCREVGLRVIYINHVHHPDANDMGTLGQRFPAIAEGKILRAGTPGVEIWPPIAPQEGDLIVEKIRQSAFPYTPLEAILKQLGVDTILVSGVSVGACVECTARDAVARDFNVVMLSDGVAGAALPDLGWGVIDPDVNRRVFLTNFKYHFGEVLSISELLEGPLSTESASEVVLES